MRPTKEYLDMISKRLETMNPGLATPEKGLGGYETFKLPGGIDQLGQTAMAYLNKKEKENQIPPDPLFPDRNSY